MGYTVSAIIARCVIVQMDVSSCSVTVCCHTRQNSVARLMRTAPFSLFAVAEASVCAVSTRSCFALQPLCGKKMLAPPAEGMLRDTVRYECLYVIDRALNQHDVTRDVTDCYERSRRTVVVRPAARA